MLAFTIGASVMLMTMVSDTAIHPPLLVDTNDSVILPFAVSETLGIYTAFSVEVFGEKVPVPFVLQFPKPVVELPDNKTSALLEQTFWSVPAETVGCEK